MQKHLICICSLLAITSPALGCEERVGGHVSDGFGGPVFGAEVDVNGTTTLTAEDGRFILDGLCPGPVELSVHHEDYEPWTQSLQTPTEHLDIVLSMDAEVIVVEADKKGERDPHARSTIEGAALEQTRGQDLAEALASVPGVTLLRTSGDATKPMVRGLFGRRLLLLRDGFRHESQKWGADHAPEVDPFAATSISVVRGAAGVRYGPDAIGGVVLMEAPHLRREAGLGGRVDLVAVSNGGRGIGAVQLDLSDGNGLSLRVAGNTAKGNDLSAPDYVLGNTASSTWNVGVTAGITRESVEFEAGWRHHSFVGGFCYCVRSSSPDELRASLLRDRPAGAESWSADRAIDRPRQEVTHDLLYGKMSTFLGPGSLELSYNLQLNRRKEYDQVRSAITAPQFDFTLRTHTLAADFVHRSLHLAPLATMEGRLGLTGNLQENVFRGLPLVPNHRASTVGAYWSEQISMGHALVEVGARVDHQQRATFLSDSAFDRHVRRGVLEPDACERTPDHARCENRWTSASVTLGGVWHDEQERFEGRLDLSNASRFPNGDELYLNGAAPSQPVFGLGNPGLRKETTWGASPTLALHLPKVRAEISSYVNLIDNYIAFAPVLTESGEQALDVTIQGTFPRYAFQQGDAFFVGLEGQGEVDLGRYLSTGLSGSMIRAWERDSRDYLPFIPADRISFKGTVHSASKEGERPMSAGLALHIVGHQGRSDASTDLAPAPDGYGLLDLMADLPIPAGEEELSVGVVVQNLLNQRYRSYTSLNRYYADDPGREVRLRASMVF